MMFVFQFNRGRNISAENLLEALTSKDWQTRVAALKFIDEKGLEISRFKSYPQLLAKSHIAERYWLAKTLGNSENPATYDDLLNFLNDPHPNVVSMALYAIGKRGNRDVVDKILQLIATTDSWYIQWYAYRALRSIGWRQTKSKQAP
jgi:HEAT repeat protein